MLEVRNVVLNTKRAAAFLGRSIYTLQSARVGRGGVLQPPWHYSPDHRPYYVVFELAEWAKAHGIEVHWGAIPMGMRLDADTLERLARARPAAREVAKPMGARWFARQGATPKPTKRIARNHKGLPAWPARPKP